LAVVVLALSSAFAICGCSSSSAGPTSQGETIADAAASTDGDAALVATLIGGGSGSTSECPPTLPALSSACPEAGLICDYDDPTSDDPMCKLDVYCQGDAGWWPSEDASLFMCPTTPPIDGQSCVCGWHRWSEGSGGECGVSCGGAQVTAQCVGDGPFGNAGAAYSRWSVPACAGADASTDGG
jgi:hypothetical protein